MNQIIKDVFVPAMGYFHVNIYIFKQRNISYASTYELICTQRIREMKRCII